MENTLQYDMLDKQNFIFLDRVHYFCLLLLRSIADLHVVIFIFLFSLLV